MAKARYNIGFGGQHAGKHGTAGMRANRVRLPPARPSPIRWCHQRLPPLQPVGQLHCPARMERQDSLGH
ncbi:hypothetical protein PCANC_10028 [Puccinia coronata f. sp. avenae]|uniref:Uncharacterized protein n=1 Tax=Puccinia coronata f. sp. avenae TaxID=200324 RepID=A0A2N5UZ12_9BASI|nr:hypothetical protein PCANC_10028 [Puccinia coronata f. sp. avenae]